MHARVGTLACLIDLTCLLIVVALRTREFHGIGHFEQDVIDVSGGEKLNSKGRRISCIGSCGRDKPWHNKRR